MDVTDDVLRAERAAAARALAEAASAAKSEFLSSMSHELRTPLNAILGFAQLLQRDRKKPLVRAPAASGSTTCMRGGEHLLRLIDDVLDLVARSRPAGSRSRPSRSASARCSTRSSRRSSRWRSAQGSSSRRSTLPADLPNVIADRTRLAQILMNFGSNAIKYGKAGGHVRFEIGLPSRASVRITVVDDGIGIPDDKHDKIFEPFQRAGQETGPIEGTGIGLAISKRLAELMKGHVGFTSEVGRGSEFWIEVPDLPGDQR